MVCTPQAAEAPADREAAARASAEPKEGTPAETEAERRAREDALLADVAQVRAKFATLALAYGRPWPEPARLADHHELLWAEARWLATDFAQARARATCNPLQHGKIPSMPIWSGSCNFCKHEHGTRC